MAQSPKTPLATSSGDVNAEQLRTAAQLVHALNHSLRRAILKLLGEQEGLTVTEIFTSLRIEQSVASQHLAILRRARLVLTERDGKFMYYSLDQARFAHLQSVLHQLSQATDETDA